jgi:hypothetical protein
MHLTSETLDLYAADVKNEEAGRHLEGCASCQRRLAHVMERRAQFSRTLTRLQTVRLSDWMQLRSITAGIRVAYDGGGD